MGKCAPCGKLVYLGKSIQAEKGDEEKGKAAEAPQPKKRAAVKPAATGNRRAASGTGKRTGTAKPDQQDKQPLQRSPSFSTRTEQYIRDLWRW